MSLLVHVFVDAAVGTSAVCSVPNGGASDGSAVPGCLWLHTV
ncbi:hypothetical protein AB0G73_37220 [Streptomyces sp. NPDC020719]